MARVSAPDSSSWVAVRGSAGASVPSTWDPETPIAAARPQPSGILLSGAVPAQKGCGGHLRLGKVVDAHSSSALSLCIGPSLRSLPKTHKEGPQGACCCWGGGEKMSPLWGSRPTPPNKNWRPLAFKGQQASPTARPRNGGPGGRAPLPCTLCATGGRGTAGLLYLKKLRGAALRHAPLDSSSGRRGRLHTYLHTPNTHIHIP